MASENFINRLLADNDFQRLHRLTMEESIFDILKIGGREITHTHLLAWILNPRSSHNLGPLPLKYFLLRVLKEIQTKYSAEEIPGGYFSETIDPILLSQIDFDKIVVSTEPTVLSDEKKGRLDVRVDYLDYNNDGMEIKNPIMVIEYKVESKMGDNQLEKYKRYFDHVALLRDKNGKIYKPLLIYLTPEYSKEKIPDEFINIDYGIMGDWIDLILSIPFKSVKCDLLLKEFKVVVDGYTQKNICELINIIKEKFKNDLTDSEKIVLTDEKYVDVRNEYLETFKLVGLSDRQIPSQNILRAKEILISVLSKNWEVNGERELMIHNIPFRESLSKKDNVKIIKNPRLQIYISGKKPVLKFYWNNNSDLSEKTILNLAESLKKAMIEEKNIDQNKICSVNGNDKNVYRFGEYDFEKIQDKTIIKLKEEIEIIESVIKGWLERDDVAVLLKT